MAETLVQPEQETRHRDRAVGKHVRRLDGINKVDGSIEYADDLPFEGYHAAVVRSTQAHGLISDIDTSQAESRPDVIAVVTGEDLDEAPWISPYTGPMFKDMPVLAIGKTRYVGEPVAAVIATSREAAQSATDEVSITYERLPPIEDVFAARADDAPLIHEHREASGVYDDVSAVDDDQEPNVVSSYAFDRGDVEAGFAEADVIVEGQYSTPMVQHTHLEPFVTIAAYDGGENSFRITTGNQTPHYVKKEIARIFDIPEADVSVKVPQIGGSYGSKTYVRMEPLVAALSRYVSEPVKLRMSLSESFDTSTRDGTVTTVKTGVTDTGEIVAQQVDIVWDTGAYADVGPRKAKKAGYTAAGAYDIPNVSVRSVSTYTNKPPAVPYRGYGVSQTAWAVESNLDDAAAELGMDPVDIRARNAVRDGGSYLGVPIENAGVLACLEAVADEFEWERDLDQPDEPHLARGRGIAIALKATITPSTSEAIVLVNSDGSVNVVVGSVKVGQGMATTMAQITADALGVDLDRIAVTPVDTDVAPFNTSTTSSRTTFHMGNALIRAAEEIKEQAIEIAASTWNVPPTELGFDAGAVADSDGQMMSLADAVGNRFVGGGGSLIGKGYYTTKHLDTSEDYQSAFWMTGASAAEVTVDIETGKYTVDRWVNATDAGRAIDPERVKGQITGASVQGLGHVRSEEMEFEGGQQVNKSLLYYKVPTIEDVPDDSRAVIVESDDPDGPYGAKGVGEANTVTVPPAVGNAIFDAVGKRVRSLPVTPEKVLRAYEGVDQE